MHDTWHITRHVAASAHRNLRVDMWTCVWSCWAAKRAISLRPLADYRGYRHTLRALYLPALQLLLIVCDAYYRYSRIYVNVYIFILTARYDDETN